MVREESHLDEMRAAIRGDFERLERRLGAQELMQVAEADEPESPAEPEEPGAPETPPEQTDADEPQELPAEPPPRSWLDRWLGR